jgi:hypothetical protein
MPKFVTKSIEIVVGKQQFKQLVIVDDRSDTLKIQEQIDKKEIEIDGILDIYEQRLESKYEKQFQGIISIMTRVANLQPVSNDKFKDVTPEKELVKEYEFKYQDLRVYAIKITNGKLILLGGYKNNQPSDYSKFRSLKKQFLENGGY